MRAAALPFLILVTACGNSAPPSAPTIPEQPPQTSDAGAPPQVTAPTAGPITLDDTSNGKTIDVRDGQTITLTLKSNPTTGYDWTVTKAPPAIGEPKTELAKPSSNREGAGTTRTFEWTVKGSLGPANSEHEIELGYRRAWEKDKEPIRTFKIILRASS